jgi:hypothetical protein
VEQESVSESLKQRLESVHEDTRSLELRLEDAITVPILLLILPIRLLLPLLDTCDYYYHWK